jgi:protein TonB
MKYLLIIFFAFCSLLVKAQVTPGSATDTTVYEYKNDLLSFKPEFPGGNEKVLRFLVKTLRYPAEARENNTQGKVVASFIVEKDGSLSAITIKKGVSKSLDDETLRIIKLSPKWNPGMIDGKPVRVLYGGFPISFALE